MYKWTSAFVKISEECDILYFYYFCVYTRSILTLDKRKILLVMNDNNYFYTFHFFRIKK